MYTTALCVNLPDLNVLELEKSSSNGLFNVSFYSSALKSSLQLVEEVKPNFLFLECEKFTYDFESLVLKSNLVTENNCKVIVITSSLNILQRFIKLGIYGAISRPFDNKEINKYLKEIIALKPSSSPFKKNKIVLKTQDTLEIVDLNEIVYAKAEGNYTKLFLKNDENILVSKNLKYIENALKSNEMFGRPHHSFIVNMNYVKRLVKVDNGILELIGSINIPISRNRKKQIFSYFL